MSEKHAALSSTTSGGRERAFAQRLHRPSAATEFRRSIHEHSGSSKRSSILFQSFTDVADPIDFEDFIVQHQPLGDETDGVGNLCEFPDDDIEVTSIPRKFRTVEKPLPKDLGLVPDPHVKDCVKSYEEDWSVVNRKYQHRSHYSGRGGDGKKRSGRTNSFAHKLFKHEYEIDDKIKQGVQDDKKSSEKTYGDMPRGSWASSTNSQHPVGVDNMSANPE